MAEKKARVSGRVFRQIAAADILILEGLSTDIRQAASLGDEEFVRIGFRLFSDTIEGFSHTLDLYNGTAASRMAGPEESGKGWHEGTPPELVENMRTAVRVYGIVIETLTKTAELMNEIEARNLDRERIQMMRKCAFTIKIGKKTIERDDPAYWSPALEEEFRDWLDYRMSSG